MRKQPKGGPALFRLVRFWSRRWTADAASLADGSGVAHVQVLEAADAVAARRACSVSDIAGELGLDLSGASRMVKACVAAGYLARAPAEADARRTELAITPAGRALLAGARAWQEATFAELVAAWPKADAARFAGYLERLARETRAPA